MLRGVVPVRSALLDQFIVSGGNFIQFVMAARFLNAGEVGKFSYAIGAGILIYMLAYAWIYQNAMALRASEDDVSDKLVDNFILLNCLICATSAPLLFFSFVFLFRGNNGLGSIEEVLLCVIFVILNQCIDFSRRMAYFTDKLLMKHPWHVSLVGMVPRLFAIWVIHPQTLADFVLILSVFMFPGVSLYIGDFIRSRAEDFFSFLKSQIRHGGWFTLNLPLNWVWGQAPVYFVGVMLGNEFAGVFASVRSITNIGNFGLELIPTYFASRLAVFRFKVGDKKYGRSFLHILAVGGGAWFAVFIFIEYLGEQIIVLILGEQYQAYGNLLLLLWFFTLILFLSRLLFLHLRFVEKTWAIPLANAIGVGVLLLMFNLLHANGLVGMAWAMLIAGVVVVITMFVASRLPVQPG